MLKQYPWFGNVRELKNVMEWVVFMYNEPEVSRWHIEQILQENYADVPEVAPYQPQQSPKHIVLPFPSGGCSLKEYSDIIIRQVLGAHNGNQTATARYFGMSLRALCYRLEDMQKRGK